MKLFPTIDNPIPAGAEVIAVRTRDGVTLRATAWRAGEPARGTVLLLQGRAEFIEKYFEVVGELRARGYDVVTFDWRGQGGSDRSLPIASRGHVRHFADFRHDYEAVWDELVATRARGPVTALAHSMGGCIALTGAAEGWVEVDRLVAAAPMLGLSVIGWPRAAQALARSLARLGLRRSYVPGGRDLSISRLPFAGNRLSTDEARYARNAAVAEALGSGAIGSPTIGWLVAAYDAMAVFDRDGSVEAIAAPTLIVGAGDDPVCSTPAIERFAKRLRNGRCLVLPGARHEIMMETDAIRHAFWEAFDAFVEQPAGPLPVPRPVLTG